MCWITKDKKCITKNIAKNDILVHKMVNVRNKEVQKKFLFRSKTVIEKEILSYWKRFEFKLGKTYRLDQKIIVESSKSQEGEFFAASIDEGFHSYSKDCPITSDQCHGIVFPKDSSSKCRLATYSDCRIMVCIIPAGSEYYENEYGEIVSNQIKPISIEEI